MKKLFTGLLIGSICLNVFLIGKNFWESMYIANEEDKIILGEMIPKVLESKQYKNLAEKEQVYSIEPKVDRNKGGVFPFHYEIAVKTNKETYYFSCTDETCKEIQIGGWGYSEYSEEKPKLPLQAENKD